MQLPTITLTLLAMAIGCHSPGSTPKSDTAIQKPHSTVFAHIGDIDPPEGYHRPSADSNSFAAWLRKVSLKKDKTVYLYNGQTKRNQTAQFAVLDVSVGNRDLQQCADAVMRLRAEYLYAQRRFNDILFIDNEGGHYSFSPPYNRSHFEAYLQQVFGMCGSASLAKQLRTTQWNQLQPGDVLIRGGFPGHAVMVMDMAQNDQGQTLYMLAQSYMPAQDIHLLLNPAKDNSPWYAVNDDTVIETPEWVFRSSELKTW